MHFAIAVITKSNPEDPGYKNEIEGLLAPYSEHLEVEPYVYATRAELIERAKGCRKRLDSGETDVTDWNRKLLDCKTDDDFWKVWTNDGTDSEAGYNENGDELSTCNPIGKWDWYTLGGRWSGDFDSQQRDCFPVKDWNFECTEEQQKRRIAWYKIVIEDAEYSEALGVSKEGYGYIKAWNNPDYYKKYFESFEDFMKEPANVPYEWLTPDGIWHSKPDTDYEDPNFAKDNKAFVRSFPEFVKQYSDYYVTIVDCHK